MNVKQAKFIPIAEVLARLGCEATRQQGAQSWHLSPLRAENTPSLHVHLGKNAWYDFGEGRGGNVLDLALAYLSASGRDASPKEALVFLSDLMGSDADSYQPLDRLPQIKPSDESGQWQLKSAKPLQHRALVQYLKGRGIPHWIAHQHLKEVEIRNSKTETKLFALGFRNEDGGWELRNPFLKSAIAPKTLTFIRGRETERRIGIHLFEGWPDFLSVLTREQGRPLQNDAIVLNALGCIGHALPYMEGYGYERMFTWMDNDAAGKKASAALAEFARSQQMACLPMNRIYAGYKDVSEWHTADTSLPQLKVKP